MVSQCQTVCVQGLTVARKLKSVCGCVCIYFEYLNRENVILRPEAIKL